MKVGDVVWVKAHKYDLSQDEPGTIVSVDGSYTDHPGDCGAQQQQQQQQQQQRRHHDGGGVQVKLHVSNVRITVSPSRIFYKDIDDDGDDGGTGDTKNKINCSTPDGDGNQRRRRIARAAKSRGVTPSPSVTQQQLGSRISSGRDSKTTTTTTTTTASKYFTPGTDGSSSSNNDEDEEEDDGGVDVVQQNEDCERDEHQVVVDDDDEPIINLKRKKPPIQHSSRSNSNKKQKTDASNTATAKQQQQQPKSKKNDTTGLARSGEKKVTAPPQLRDAAAAAASKKNTKKNTTKKKKDDDPNDLPLIMASDTDSDDDKDRPYHVEYATSCRATCRSCDQRIEKGDVRIASRPLFRGKPGFVVYRHLSCQLLPPDEVPNLASVGGWRRLKQSDRKLLEAQIHESVRLVEKENEELDADELVQTAFTGEIRPPPPGLAASLLPFQVEGVSWMYCQEISDIKGGILADEMGMGKTLQTITTILDNRPLLQHVKPGTKHPPSSPDIDKRKEEEILWEKSVKECHHALKMAGVPDSILEAASVTKSKKTTTKKGASSPGSTYEIGARAGTLVICPVIALTQWKSEIEKFTEDKALSVCVYHGTDRRTKFPQELLCKYDVILTTYQVIEADFRKMVSPNKVKCPNCGQSYKIDKLAVHLKYFCGESAQRTEAQMRQRRTAERHRPSSGGNSRQGGGGGERADNKSKSTKTLKKRKHSSKQIPPKKKSEASKTVAAKKTVRARGSVDYDSDSSLSVLEDDPTSKRPSRAAAKSATKKMSASAQMWADGFDDDDRDDSVRLDESSSSEDDDDDASKDESARTSSTKQALINSSSTSESDSEDEDAMARVRKRQERALAMATKDKKITINKKAKRKVSTGKKNKKSNSSNSDDDSDDNGVSGNDPLDGVDMEALKAEAMDGCEVSLLHTMCFFRVVLDEAHNIKSRSSQTAAAAFHLTSVHRWCLSGTPLQNRVGELYSLIRFLQIDPWAHYCCRKEDCDCKSIFYRMKNGVCQDCGHGSIQHYSYFNRKVLNVIQREGYSGDGRRAMMKLKSEVLDKSLLRRTKDSRAEDMNLPPRVVTIKPIRLHPREQDFYDGLYTQTKTSFDDYVDQGLVLNNFAHLFDLLTKLRQSVDHPYLLVYSKKNSSSLRPGPSSPIVLAACELCEETPTDRVVSSCCDAAFCRSCVVDMMSSLENANVTRCPRCQNPFTIDLNQENGPSIEDDDVLKVASNTSTDGMPLLKEMSHVASGSILRRIPLSEFATSTKIEALVQELVQMRQERPGNKALVFSQFVNMLDLVRWRLHSDPCLLNLGLGVRIIHGGMNVQSRDEALKAFREDPSIRVLLMSLKAGGVALNLTVASEAYLLDPWWNPAAEMQAIDRTHRLGQYRPIRAVRFICEGTVEERVLQLQEKKRLVFDGTVGRDAASLKMLTVEDMKGLFT